jgi:DNA polymerase-1
VRVLFVGRRGADHVDYDEAAVRERFGVAPAELPTLRAFLGDPADELPGLSGVGPRTAARWVVAHGAIDAIVARAAELRPPHLGALVARSADTLRRVESLGRLIDDLPIGAPPHHAPWDDAARDRLRGWFEALEFRSLLGRLSPPPPPPAPR